MGASSATSSLSQRKIDILFLVYFVVHIPTTIFFDCQSLFPDYYPQALKSIVVDYVAALQDPFVLANPPWFVALVTCETFLQLPFFFYSVWALIKGKNSYRIPGIIYGVHTATTLAPLLAEIWLGAGITEQNRLILSAIYGVYLVVPLMLVARLWAYKAPFTVATAVATPSSKKTKQK